ncbi:hypothetical protein FisN_8Lh328 [Fistulifera solaris]|uniref:Globin domain-containing protein n=1 Tax=Fistulifera solaris TaxID=1519565 RepID=A0A1Z5JNP0_FISSO|nr:hypothetical protein FisN_8Lh328 [Fistulifera solaris]|eukprot:GAX15378.1 hypothetical protein FisN_8Lh328 [Fistulifera solaris]
MTNHPEVLSSTSLLKVIACWEQSKSRGGFDETIGIELMLTLFEMNPQARSQFGFRTDQVIDKNNGLQRMGILIHGQRFIRTLDCLFSLLGPDDDNLEEVLRDFNKESCQDGMPLPQFLLLLGILVKVMAHTLGGDWTDEVQFCWMEVITHLEVIVTNIVAKSAIQKTSVTKNPLKPVLPTAREPNRRFIDV